MRRRPVSVLPLPTQCGAKEVRTFMREVGNCMEVDRPQLVLDCSTVQRLDNSRIHLLLCCLEEAMKRNGDVKLSGIPMDADGEHHLSGVNRLFESFENTTDAVNSFHQLPGHAIPDVLAPCAATRDAGNAA